MLVLTYGLIAGLGMIVVDLIMTGGSGSGGGFIGWVILIGSVVWAHRKLKQNGDGSLSYGKALGSGVGISMFAGLVLGLYSFIIYSVNGERIQEILNEVAYTMESMGFDGEEFDSIMALYEQILTPPILGFLSVVGTIILGFILSLFIGLFTSKAKTELDIE